MAAALLLVLGGCTQQPERVASNCEQSEGCAETEVPLDRIDAVDILLVVDSSGSIASEAELLKAQLPRMLNAIVTGSDEDMSFPPASSVHVAVTTSDLGVGVPDIEKCEGLGDDGVFIQPGQAELNCELSYPGYLAYEGSPAAVATVETVSCVPVVGSDGCGFEQPLEAGLKALWPASDPSLSFATGASHGDSENAGFLRANSLLVVVVVSDEDDCSAADPSIFSPMHLLDPSDPLASQDLNLRCFYNPDALHPVDRYVDGFKALRPDGDNVIFVAVGGIPPELVSAERRASYDFAQPDQVAAYFDHVLADPGMEQAPDPTRDPAAGGQLRPACRTGSETTAYPSRRLVEVAKGFGTEGVLASVCDADFGATTGHIIRAIGTRLTEAAGE